MLVAGCARGGAERATPSGDDLRPTYPAETIAVPGSSTTATPAGGPTPTSPTSPTTAPASVTPTAPAPSTAPGPGTPERTVTASITDPTGDATPSPVDRPPPWADLAGATLTRRSSGFELRVRLGGAAPASTDADHTMNIAAFFDVDGDGAVDYEVWANVADGGWGGSWFDNTRGTSRYGRDAGVTWTPEGDEVVLRFPLDHVGGAAQFRWSLASEWGRYEVLGSPASARDDAPDDDRPAGFG